MVTWDVASTKSTFFLEAEEILLGHGGRVSWARLFFSSSEKVLKNYPEFPKFLDVKQKLDPTNLFSNKFSDNLLGMETTDEK